ncbi:hypothetical protein WJX72_003892 [[Myrmecia] bisecta]|uniref:PLOD1-3-like GT domain-containing protein n=1 Tax=[Myrmecia] bisecta TaxID=41462 RepID=A0AAW1P8U1_9CHLO
MEPAQDPHTNSHINTSNALPGAEPGATAVLLATGKIGGIRRFTSVDQIPAGYLSGPQARRLPVLIQGFERHGDFLLARVVHYPWMRRMLDRYRGLPPPTYGQGDQLGSIAVYLAGVAEITQQAFADLDAKLPRYSIHTLRLLALTEPHLGVFSMPRAEAPRLALPAMSQPAPSHAEAGNALVPQAAAAAEPSRMSQAPAIEEMLWGELYVATRRLPLSPLWWRRTDVCQLLLTRGQAVAMEGEDLDWLGIHYQRVIKLQEWEAEAKAAGAGMWAHYTMHARFSRRLRDTLDHVHRQATNMKVLHLDEQHARAHKTPGGRPPAAAGRTNEKDMTYAKQLEEYENAVMQKWLEEMPACLRSLLSARCGLMKHASFTLRASPLATRNGKLVAGALLFCLCLTAWQLATSGSASGAQRSHQLEVISVATSDRPSLQALNASSPFKFTALGLGKEWKGYRVKLFPLVPYLREKHPDDLVLIVDAFDVLFLPKCGRDLVKEFHKLKADIVFNAESNCWPDEWKREFYPRVLHGIPKMQFLNSGLYMGRVKHILYYLLKYFLEAGQWNAADFDDQRFWTDIYLASHFANRMMQTGEPTIRLDSTGTMFQILNPPNENNPWTWKHDLATDQVYTSDGPYTRPACVLHGPSHKVDFWEVMHKRLTTGGEVIYSAELLEAYNAEVKKKEEAAAANAAKLPKKGCTFNPFGRCV